VWTFAEDCSSSPFTPSSKKELRLRRIDHELTEIIPAAPDLHAIEIPSSNVNDTADTK
jgi:hypothetical protein